MKPSLNLLVERLTPNLRYALEQAAWRCRSMTHYDVELEHLLLELSADESADCARILRHFDVDPGRLASDLTVALERLRRGNTRDTPGISPKIGELLSAAWMHSSLELGGRELRSGSVLYALLAGAETNLLANRISKELKRIDTDALAGRFAALVEGSTEGSARAATATDGAPPAAPALDGKAKALERFTIDLTARARAGRIDPVLGRDREVRQMIDVLMRRRQNNPILTGEPGVGKTAVVEGFALKIACGDVPEPLKNVAVRTLDLGLLQAGAGVRGEFEERLKSVIQEVLGSATPIILFIDEAHTLIGAGGAEGQNDAANLLKPPLARGELRTIAATTWAEYKKYFEKDAALARRFQVVKVEEPDEEAATVMLRGVAPVLERHHKVHILPEALQAAVRWSSRYLADRQLPDKAISVLDTACARVAVAQAATPGPVEDHQRRIADLEAEEALLVRETAAGADHGFRLRELAAEVEKARADLRGLEERWGRERDLVQEILGTRARLDPTKSGETEREGLIGTLRASEQKLHELQGEEPLIHPTVDAQGVAAVLSAWTGIPVGRMLADEVQTVLELEAHLARRVIGQDPALRCLAECIRTARAGMGDPGRPIGVFLLLGPSGVGKTETALSLAELLFGGERNLITINMSEYQEAHTVSGLKGSPPGYVGYGQGGVLTEAVRRRPFSVVLLDEVEKAHPDVLELFYQVFDKGTLEDGEGRRIDFKNTVILLTSNVASAAIQRLCQVADDRPDLEELRRAVRAEVTTRFKPALVGRMTVVPYAPLSNEVLRRIVELKVARIAARLREQHGATLAVAPEVVDAVLERCEAAETGARNVDHVLNGSVLPEISRRILRGLVESALPRQISVRVGAAGDFDYEVVAT